MAPVLRQHSTAPRPACMKIAGRQLLGMEVAGIVMFGNECSRGKF